MATTKSDFFLQCAALAMHAELNSAGSFDEPAKALCMRAEQEMGATGEDDEVEL